MSKKLPQSMIAIAASVEMKAAAAGEDGTPKGPPEFTSTFYNGGPVQIAGYDLPVVLDLSGVENRNNLVANLDHDDTQRVGQFTAANDGKQLVATGKANAKTSARDQVIGSAEEGWNWEASFEAQPRVIETIAKGKKIQVNGQSLTGPLYVARESTLLGMGFVSHGADAQTSVTIAASADFTRENKVHPKLEAWIKEIGLDPENMSDADLETIKANYGGSSPKPVELETFGDLKAESERKQSITKLAIKASANRFPTEIEAIERMAENAIKAGTTARDFELELYRQAAPGAHIPGSGSSDPGLTNRVLEAAVCKSGGMPTDVLEKSFDDQTLQAAHDRFRNGIGLNQLVFEGAKAQGHGHQYERHVNKSTLEAAFKGSQMNAAAGWSTVDIPTILSNVANKFLRIGWEYVESAWSEISTIRSVSDFKEITTVSLTADATFDKLGAGDTIKHGTAGEVTYANKADTYARMFGITRTDFINDDLSALTRLPQKIGRGGALKLNNIFWTEFLDNAAFFSAGNNNLLTGAGSTLDRDGLNAAEVAFRKQTDPEGEPLGAMPEILLVPVSLVNTALELMGAQTLIGQGADAPSYPNRNIYGGRYRVVSSIYMENANYTGNSATAWYLLGTPMDLPVIEVAALNGNVMPTVESADADFNVLGVQMRGYSDVGVRKQEYRGGVKSAGA